MKRNVYWSLCAAAIGMALLTAALTLWSAHGLLVRQVQQELRDEHKLIARSVAYTGEERLDYLSSLDIRFDSFRVTLITPEGGVLFDSDNDRAGMENHLDRPEVREALSVGSGEDIRRSETMGLDTCYYAAALPDGSVLRVSKQTRSIGAVFAGVIPLMAGIVLVTLLLSMLLASRLTRRLVRPVEALAEDLENTASLRGYEELEPFYRKLREKNRLIGEQMERLRAERDTIKTITSNMKEGLLLLGREKEVLSVNAAALSLLGSPAGEYEGKNVLVVTRDAELGACIERAAGGEGADVVLERDGRACHAFASPVREDGGQVAGTIVLLLDVTEQQRAEQVRREFTANVSHELKTPLTSISGFAEMLQNGMASGEEDVKRFAGRIYSEARRLIALTDDIIRLSRIEQSGAVEDEPVELRALCEGAAEALRFPAEQKQVAIAVSGDLVTVRGSRQMLDELVCNLADNAVKYNRPGGRVDLSVRREGDWAAVTVADTGIGIPREHQARIFERFYRVDKSRSKQTGGTGLGLSIVKHIVERHGGSISLESAPGAGTSVTVRLPFSGGFEKPPETRNF